MSALPQPATPPVPATPLPTRRDWLEAAQARSVWLDAVPGLRAMSGQLHAQNRSLRQAVARQAGRLVSDARTRDRVVRTAEVGFELVAQLIALALDLRDAARAADEPLLGWWRRQRVDAGDVRRRVLEEGFDPEARALRLAAERLAGADPIRGAAARRLRITAESLGPTFVKFGQLLASAEGLLPNEVVAEFGRCRDEVRPEPTARIVEEIEAALGRVGSVFASFDPTPIAAASIAQVHAAVLPDGRDVVVKVRRPGIASCIRRDVAVLSRLAAAAARVDKIDLVNLPGLVSLFAETVLEEMDFRLEAENMIDCALAVEDAGLTEVVVPHPEPGMVTQSVLVMERIHGLRFHDAESMAAAGVDVTRMLQVGLQAVIEGATIYGIFHADLHAGNVLALPDGRFGLVDFGIVGRLDDERRTGLAHWLIALASDDLPMQIRSLRDLGAFPDGTDVEELAGAVEAALPSLADMEERSFDELVSRFELVLGVLEAAGMRLPREIALFFKDVLHLNGTTRALVPDLKPFDEVDAAVADFRAKYDLA